MSVNVTDELVMLCEIKRKPQDKWRWYNLPTEKEFGPEFNSIEQARRWLGWPRADEIRYWLTED